MKCKKKWNITDRKRKTAEGEFKSPFGCFSLYTSYRSSDAKRSIKRYHFFTILKPEVFCGELDDIIGVIGYTISVTNIRVKISVKI